MGELLKVMSVILFCRVNRIEKEWLDETRFVPIITDLMRTSQPIVRYRLDDVLVIDESKEHGESIRQAIRAATVRERKS